MIVSISTWVFCKYCNYPFKGDSSGNKLCAKCQM
ncbi:hypothetical protein [Vibrio phage nt-1]|uniref:Uncharacterized protein n=1 Tax=Vibrio phage nt-1 TaxID=115992 RepID=A0A068J939_9CAUD|nr:hypothetical protein [Vibrio phage nt-1]AIE13772.1 hypothetical protein [Vibrio phage nt-1]